MDADTLPEFLSDDYPEAIDLRTLMSVLPPDELAIAGHAAALSQWHKVGALVILPGTSFCGACSGKCINLQECMRGRGRGSHRKEPASPEYGRPLQLQPSQMLQDLLDSGGRN